MIVLRKATKDDRWNLRKMVLQARINPLGVDWKRFTVAEKDGQIVGCVQRKPHPHGLQELSSLVVLPASRGHGVGGKLIQDCIQGATGQLFLVCGDDLETYYEAYGFVTVPVSQMNPFYKRFYYLSKIFWPLLFQGTTVVLMKLTL